ncbi:hypothetical protein [Agromyces laixinhei]|uniref:hypothetical protein n=1 Tax=Agromyces laixinhei TaxID=2585717 RepID=UPI0011171796|nr:hypothetical protein [Agromyces laixinhei]
MTEASVPTGPTAPVADTPAARPATPLWLAITIAVAFGVFYAYDVWEAVGNLVGLNITAAELGIAMTGAGWALLIVGVAVPFLVFGSAFWLGRRRGPLAQAVLFLAGYALVQVLTADVSAYFALGGLDFS